MPPSFLMKTSIEGTAADPTLRFTPLTIGKRTYQLIYDYEAVATAEELTGLELLVGVNWTKINARRIRAMLYASLLKAQPQITLEEIGKLITVPNLPAIESALAKAWLNSTPDPEEYGENPPMPSPTNGAATANSGNEAKPLLA